MPRQRRGSKKKTQIKSNSSAPLKCTSWDQKDTLITLVIDLQNKVNSNDISAEILSKEIKIFLTDGRKFQTKLAHEIKKEKCRTVCQDNQLYIYVEKKDPNIHWNCFEELPLFSKEEQDLNEKEKTEVGLGGGHGDIKEEDSQELDHRKVKADDNVLPSNSQVGWDSQVDSTTGKIKPNAVLANCIGESIPQANEKETIKDVQMEKDDDDDDNRNSTHGNVIELQHLRTDFYDKGEKGISVVLFVKGVSNESFAPDFKEKSIAVNFSTRDKKFLGLYPGSHENSRFHWAINIFDFIDVDACTYKVKSLTVELFLKKKEDRKWKTLEAPIAPSSSHDFTDTNWNPVVKTPPIISPEVKDDKRIGTVAFDELNNKPTRRAGVSWSIDNEPDDNITLFDNKEAPSKPTCMVSPLNKPENPIIVSRGMTGLDNLGNTCFMNSVLQVLANTRELRDFFLDGRFQKDINAENPLSSGGKLAVSFAVLLKVLWSGKNYSYAPSKLKALVATKASQFTGFAQHDAQEFMAFLLDGLHEDINRIKEKPYTQTVDSEDKPDDVVAKEAWQVHKKRNDSFVVDLLQGQYKSKLVCPVCKKVSITFDPFSVLPVPIPKKKRLLSVIYMSKDISCKPVKYMLRLPQDASVDALKEQITSKTSSKAKDLHVFESYKHAIHQVFDRNNSLNAVTPNDKIIVVETLSEELANESVLYIYIFQFLMYPSIMPQRCNYCKKMCPEGGKLKRCTRCYKTAYCDQGCQKSHWTDGHQRMCRLVNEAAGEPFLISIPKTQATYQNIVRMVQARARHSMNIFQPPVNTKQEKNVVDETSAMNAVKPCSDNQDTVSNDSVSMDYDTVDTGGMSPMKSDSAPEEMFASKEKYRPEEKDVDGKEKKSIPSQCVLGRSQEEPQLAPFKMKALDINGREISLHGSESALLEDMGDTPLELDDVKVINVIWKNHETCSPYVLAESKEMDCVEDESMNMLNMNEEANCTLDQCMSLFTEPEVLSPEHAWYCPRCKEHREATKQLSIWKLPHTLIIQLKRFSFSNYLWRDKIDKLIDFPTRGLDMSDYFIGNRPVDEPPPIYDLYGVVNHYGGILGGHYTAYARCPDPIYPDRDEVGWRLFDDSMVSHTSEKQVVTKASYVLFYRRRDHTFSNVALLDEGSLLSSVQDGESSGTISSSSTCETITSDINRESDDDFQDAVEDVHSSAHQSDDSLSNVRVANVGPAFSIGETLNKTYTDMETVD